MIRFSVARSSSSQRGSGAPLRNQSLPLSARSMPYRCKAARMTRAAGGNPAIRYEAFSRTRIPIGGKPGSSERLAKCRAGGT